MSAAQFQAEVMDELRASDDERQTVWACMFCGRDVGGEEPATFICCSEIGHTHLVFEDDGEPVDD